tara:strand:+ start:89 stop:1336 length:1248 start_codon:yes stop_codon:yes gene_type:complete
MSDGYGTPIRLHFDGGILRDVANFVGFGDDPFPPMELQALSIALSVERKVGGMPLPLMGGKRLGIDLNMVNSTIVIEGIFTDDDVNRRITVSSGANGFIDFSTEHVYNNSNGFAIVDTSRFANLVGSESKLVITQKNGDEKEIEFTLNATASHYTNPGVSNVQTGGGVTLIHIHPTNFLTHAQMAQSIQTALGPSHLNSTINATLAASDFTGLANSKVVLQETTVGRMSGAGSIVFKNASTYAPMHQPLTGGRDSATHKPKSAGDKVQDLYGILHNTSRGTAALVAGALIGLVAAPAAVGAGAALGAGAAGGALAGLGGFFNGDYPIGLQIPYNSMITAPDGKKYSVRNFLIRTGIESTNNKVSDGNNHDANQAFSTFDNTTGIQGTIQKFDVGYNAGEQHYTYQMVFAPIDMII